MRNIYNGADHVKYQGVVTTVLLDWVFCFDQNTCSSSMQHWNPPPPPVPNHAQLQFEAHYYKHVKPLHRSHEPQTRVAWTKVEIRTRAEADGWGGISPSLQTVLEAWQDKKPFLWDTFLFSQGFSLGSSNCTQKVIYMLHNESPPVAAWDSIIQMLILAQEGGRIEGGD